MQEEDIMVIETTELRGALKDLHQRVDTVGGYL